MDNIPKESPTPMLPEEGLDNFVAHLRKLKYRVDSEQIASAYRLLILAATSRWPGAEHRLGNLLAPLFARNSAEQENIRNIVDRDWSDQILL